MKILIVDDSAIARNCIATQILTDPSMEIVGYAENGSQALELNRILNPDLILMDIHMPVMDGLEATRQISSSNPTPIVILTDDFTRQNVTDAQLYGAIDVIDKPSLSWERKDIQAFINHLYYYASINLPQIK